MFRNVKLATIDIIIEVLLALFTLLVAIFPTAICSATAVKWKSTTQKGVGNDTQRPQIAALVIG